VTVLWSSVSDEKFPDLILFLRLRRKCHQKPTDQKLTLKADKINDLGGTYNPKTTF
jgi:hypothetical protein